ncbi:MAG TPA: hypothetical protein VHN14_35305 [Kofleriaceae bacterium]|jgi:hypothetical protein|nr:hypothetical protein [Kofleriaceae bacterium]
MPKPYPAWRVLPHRPLTQLSERVWRLEGDLENMAMKRVMTIARRGDGGLVVHSAIAADDPTMAMIAKLGEIRTILVPNRFHRLDAKVFHARFPAAQIVCPAGACAKVEQVVPVNATYDAIPADGAVELQPLDGTKAREGAMIVRDGDGTTVVLNDIVFNMPHAPGIQRFVRKNLLRSSGGLRITLTARLFLVADKVALRGHLERLAALPGLRRVIVSHHETIEREPARALVSAAAML